MAKKIDTENNTMPRAPVRMTAAERKHAAKMSRGMIRWPNHRFGRKYQTPSAMEPAIHEYFESCADLGRPYTVGGLASFLGMSIQNLIAYKKGHRGETPEDAEEFKGMLAMAYQIIETSKEEMALLGNYNATFAIFDLKASHNWVDKQVVDHQSSDNSVNVTRRVVDPQEPSSDYDEDGAEETPEAED